MVQRMKVGNVYVDVPDGSAGPNRIGDNPQTLEAEKPETPEKFENEPYLYQPNDPLRHGIDQVQAISSISAEHKPWVRKTFFIFFVVVPFVFIELGAFTMVKMLPKGGWSTVLLWNVCLIPFWLFYYIVWRRNVKGKTKR